MRIFTRLMMLLAIMATAITSWGQTNYKSMKWADICSGKMSADWYGSDEAKAVADVLISVQKDNGGWMKNYQYHQFVEPVASEYASDAMSEKNSKGDHSCFDNYATTQEMRFLLRVYRKTNEQKYLDSFVKALNLIITAGKGKNGGWGQYWPDSSDKWSYQNYITFNDDLMTNIMKMLQEVYQAKGDFKDLVDETTKTACEEAWNKALECVLKCQIDDNGTKAAWCAQHDPVDFLPTEGRPHEMPSVSAYESSTLLKYLMTIEHPSDELKASIRAAVDWLSKHKYMENKYIEDVKEGSTTVDRRIADKEGSNIWGRFIQIGGESGKVVYNKFHKKLKDRGKKRDHHLGGYSYYEYEILEESYDFTKEYQPIFAIYTNDYPELFYRHLYKYDGPADDSENIIDKHGKSVRTSLPPANRISYQYLGSWCDEVINVAYPAWETRMKIEEAAGDAKVVELSDATKTAATSALYSFSNNDIDISIANGSNKGYATGKNNTIKYSAGVNYTINIPENKAITKIIFYGYNNNKEETEDQKVPAYIATLNKENYNASEYVFPIKEEGTPVYKSFEIELSDPAVTTLPFKVNGNQCCLVITVYVADITSSLESIVTIDGNDLKDGKYMTNEGIMIIKSGRKYKL